MSGISEQTRRKVDRAVGQLGYRTNTTARALATNRSKRIGAVVFELTEFGPSAIVKGAASAARKAGFLLDIVSLDGSDHASISEALDILTEQDFAGIFAVGPAAMIHKELESRAFAVPVSLEAEDVDSPFDQPHSLNGQGAELMMDELIGMGHSRIGHVGGPIGWTSTTNRELAYWRALTRRGLPTFPILRGDWSARSGYAAGLAWPLDLETTAIFAANDHMALGLLSAFRDRGLSVPDQISVVGFDDIPEAEFMAPPLTTVRLDFFDLGVRRIHGLIAQIQGTQPKSDPQGGIVELIRRRSIQSI
jgi:LacI family transcriptional regulator